MSGKSTLTLGKSHHNLQHSRTESSASTPVGRHHEFNAPATPGDKNIPSTGLIASTPCTRCLHRGEGAECMIAKYDKDTRKATCKQCLDNKNNYCNVKYNAADFYIIPGTPLLTNVTIKAETTFTTPPVLTFRTARSISIHLNSQLMDAQAQIAEGQRMVKAGYEMATAGQTRIQEAQEKIKQAYNDVKEGQEKFQEGMDLTEKGMRVLEKGYEANMLAKGAVKAIETWKEW